MVDSNGVRTCVPYGTVSGPMVREATAANELKNRWGNPLSVRLCPSALLLGMLKRYGPPCFKSWLNPNESSSVVVYLLERVWLSATGFHVPGRRRAVDHQRGKINMWTWGMTLVSS